MMEPRASLSRRNRAALIGALVVACGSSPVTPTSANTPTTTTISANAINFPDAISIRAVGGADDSVWVARTEGADLLVAKVNPEVGEVSSPVVVSGPEGVINHPLERPALAITEDGSVLVAWITGEGNVKLATINSEGVVGSAEVISGEARPETALVQMIATNQGEPVVSWLEDSTLSVAAGEPLVERELVDDLTCDCCHPVPIQMGDDLGIGYRDLERGNDGVVRDIAFLGGSLTGESFTAPVVVADEHWFLDACPLSGPTLALNGDDLLISWMDARQSLHPEQRSSSIWFDSSGDGGETFGTDIRLTDDQAAYRTPAMAVDDSGTVYLVWERRTAEEATLEYAYSTDGGQTFTEPDALVEGNEESGVPREATLVIIGERMLVSWADGKGGHIGIWPLT